MDNRFRDIGRLASDWTHRMEVYQVVAYSFVVVSVHAIVILPFKLAFPVAILFLACARYFFILAREAKKRKERLEVGLTAEAGVQEMLVKELPSTWLVEANVQVPHRGDVDLFVTSPSNKYYAIEVKSHQTEVLFDGRRLRRGNGGFFEKDFLKQASGTAATLKRMRRVSYVNAVLVFTRATLSLVDSQVGHVKVLRSGELIEHLLSQERNGRRKVNHVSAENYTQRPHSRSSILGALTSNDSPFAN